MSGSSAGVLLAGLVAVTGIALAAVRWDMARQERRRRRERDERLISQAREQLAIDVIFRIIISDIEED